jgi:hypothetical protein
VPPVQVLHQPVGGKHDRPLHPDCMRCPPNDAFGARDRSLPGRIRHDHRETLSPWGGLGS